MRGERAWYPLSVHAPIFKVLGPGYKATSLSCVHVNAMCMYVHYVALSYRQRVHLSESTMYMPTCMYDGFMHYSEKEENL